MHLTGNICAFLIMCPNILDTLVIGNYIRFPCKMHVDHTRHDMIFISIKQVFCTTECICIYAAPVDKDHPRECHTLPIQCAVTFISSFAKGRQRINDQVREYKTQYSLIKKSDNLTRDGH